MRARAATVAALLGACGLNVGSPPRRVFPNPPSTTALDRIALTMPVERPPPICRVPGGANARVDDGAPAPWGVRMKGPEVTGIVPPVAAVASALRAQVQAALRTCPAGAPMRHRVVIDRVEVNAYDRYDVARVVLRMERFTEQFDQFTSWRAEGRIRTMPGAVDVATLVRSATDSALDDLLAREGAR